MGIWIKTPDTKLTYGIRFCVSFTGVDKWSVECELSTAEFTYLHSYASEKRAKEVIDMIHEHINKLEYFRATGNISAAVPAVFEMPKE